MFLVSPVDGIDSSSRGREWTVAPAAVPANGPAANESQPHPLAGLRVLGGAQGPQELKTPPKRGFGSGAKLTLVRPTEWFQLQLQQRHSQFLIHPQQRRA